MFERQQGTRKDRRPQLEVAELESRKLMVASLLPIPNIGVPVTVGYQVPVLSATGGANQTFTVRTNNNNIQASVAQGQFMTINVAHQSSGPGDISFAGPMTFELFNDLTPLTASKIEELVTRGFYTNNTFHRVASGFPDANGFIVQGGSANNLGGGAVDIPGFPFQDEFNLQLVYDGVGQLAMANAFSAGGFDTNSSQFFITTGSPRFLDFENPIFGQLVSGFDILQDMTKVLRTSGNPADQSASTPVSPIVITSASLSNVNPNGVIHIDTRNSQPGIATQVVVTATDPSTGTTASQAFTVTTTANIDPSTGQPINERAILAPLPAQEFTIGPSQTFTLQTHGADAEPNDTLTFQVAGGLTADRSAFTSVQNATASISPAGVLTVTPTPGFTGDIPILVGVRDQVDHSRTGNINNPSSFDMHSITLHVSSESSGVRVVTAGLSHVLVVTPPSNTPGGANNIVVDEQNGAIQVFMDGAINGIEPQAAGIDRIVIYGAKANDSIVVTPAVLADIPVTMDGGHGGFNALTAGGGPTRLHGWFGKNVLQGGPNNDALIGQQGHVRFLPSGGQDLIYAGVIPPLAKHSTHHIAVRLHHFSPPSGTFYAFVGNHLLPLRQAAQHVPHTPAGSTPATGSQSQAQAAQLQALRQSQVRSQNRY